MDLQDVRDHITRSFRDTRHVEANGDSFFVHDPDGTLPERWQPWATIVTSDVNDPFSDLERPGVFRVNMGLPKGRFRELIPADQEERDWTELDVVVPHPVYGAQHWVCVLNPQSTWPLTQELLHDAHEFALRKAENTRARRLGS